jgi:hypothetical protein
MPKNTSDEVARTSASIRRIPHRRIVHRDPMLFSRDFVPYVRFSWVIHWDIWLRQPASLFPRPTTIVVR